MVENRLLVFDSHPVQYRAPIWRRLEELQPGTAHIFYATDCSVRGHRDSGFGRDLTWDTPLLEGYPHTVLNCENGVPLSSWSSLTGAGVLDLLGSQSATAVLLTGLNYRYDWVAFWAARKRNLPISLRCETQDKAFERPPWKSLARSIIYRLIYQNLDRAFFIGELNRQHYLAHGVPPDRLHPARYGTVDRFKSMDRTEKEELRQRFRSSAGGTKQSLVIGFSGKMIPKKNPGMLFAMLEHLPSNIRSRVLLYFLGSGELEPELRNLAQSARMTHGVETWFAGFANQSELPGHYLAMDILVLPSRRMGETWGLVANEAMQAGCAVAVSDAVGCSGDFREWERFCVFAADDPFDLARSVGQLAQFSRSFDWARPQLIDYSIEATARALLESL